MTNRDAIQMTADFLEVAASKAPELVERLAARGKLTKSQLNGLAWFDLVPRTVAEVEAEAQAELPLAKKAPKKKAAKKDK